jgi:hypothetical protein
MENLTVAYASCNGLNPPLNMLVSTKIQSSSVIIVKFPDDDQIVVESKNIKMFIFGVTVVLYFIKILSGSRD